MGRLAGFVAIAACGLLVAVTFGKEFAVADLIARREMKPDPSPVRVRAGWSDQQRSPWSWTAKHDWNGLEMQLSLVTWCQYRDYCQLANITHEHE
jgi:hypothetical protein